ncbi:MAG: conjugal transfer protein TraF [Azospirillum sp.]|nr:conjugal transfer protein TraF [Azospirillum sp.]
MTAGSIAALTAAGVALIGAPIALPQRPILVWNATASVPIGLYRIGLPSTLRTGDLVLVQAPPELAPDWAARGYLPLGVPLLKPVAATAGDTVCREGPNLTIDGRPVAIALPADTHGRALPEWFGCRVLGPGQLFLLNPVVPDSLDGRYFGPVSIGSIIGKAVALWTR